MSGRVEGLPQCEAATTERQIQRQGSARTCEDNLCEVTLDDLFEVQEKIKPFVNALHNTNLSSLQRTLVDDYANCDQQISLVCTQMAMIKRRLENLRVLFEVTAAGADRVSNDVY